MIRAKQVWKAAGFILVSLITLTHTSTTRSHQNDSSGNFGQVVAAGVNDQRIAILPTQRIPLAGSAVAAAAVAPNGIHAAIVDSDRSDLKIVDTIAGEVLFSITLRSRPSTVALDESGSIAVVGYADAPVLDVIGLRDSSLSNSVSLPTAAGRIRVSSVLKKVIATLPEANALAVYDMRRKTLSLVDVGRNPTGVDIDQATNSVLVANRDDNTISLVSLFTLSVIVSDWAGEQPEDVAVDWTSGVAYVACAGSGRITRFDMVKHTTLQDLTTDAINGLSRLALFPEHPQGRVRGLLVASSSVERSLTVFNLVQQTQWRIETGGSVSDLGASPVSGRALILNGGSELFAYDIQPLSPPVISSVELLSSNSSDEKNLVIRGFNFSVSANAVGAAGSGGSPEFAVMVGEGPALRAFLIDDLTATAVSSGNLRRVPFRTVNANGYSNPVYLRDPSLAPRIEAITPNSGPQSGGISCRIRGENFLDGSPGTTSVWFDDNPAADVVVVDENTIQCTVPAGTGRANVEVRNDQGSRINADDFIYLSPGFHINDIQVLEGDSGTVNAVFTVTLSPTSTVTEVIDYSTQNGTAQAGSDYVAKSGRLAFAPGVSTQTITISVIGDTLIEPDEFFYVNLFQPLLAAGPSDRVDAPISDGQGFCQIQNNDNKVFIGNASPTEPDTGTSNTVFVVTVSPPAGPAGLTLSFSTADGTARAGSDYVATSGRLTYAPGEGSKLITVPIIGDVLDEANETFFVNLSAVSNGVIADGQGLGTIIDNDPAPTLAINDASVTEGDAGSVNATFTVTLTGQTAQDVSVNFAIANGTATGGADYASTTGSLIFKVGVTSRTITVAILGDLLDEDNETFFVNLSGATNAIIADSQGLGTIIDNDPLPNLTINDRSLAEGNAGTVNMVFTVLLSAPSGRTVTVNFATANGTATAGSDYTATSGSLSFGPGARSMTVAVPIIGDTAAEPDENFFVNLSGAVNATIADSQGVGTILNDDGTPAVFVSDVILAEGNSGTTDAVFQISLSPTSTTSISVFFATADGTATAGSDYTAPPTGSVTFAPGETTKTVPVPVLGDTLNEPDENFFLNITDTTGPVTVGDGQGEATIINDDGPPGISINDISVTEGNSGTVAAVFTVTLSAASGQIVTVDFSTGDGSASALEDYTPQSGTLTFAPGETSKTISVAVLGDTFNEPSETFVVNLSNATNANISDGQGTCTIFNDDAFPTLSINSISVTEGTGGTVNAVLTVTMSPVSGQTVTVDFGTADGTASAGSDYFPASGTLTFVPDVTSQTITVPVISDNLNEAPETFLVNLSNPSNATIAIGLGTVSIVDDDPFPSVTINDVRVTEGNSGTTDAVFTVTLSAPSGQSVTVAFSTSDGTATSGSGSPGEADYIPNSGFVTFNPGDTLQTISVSVIGDTSKEPDETFFVNLTLPPGAPPSKSQGQCTIINDDGVGPMISIEDTSVTEGNSGTANATFRVMLSEPSSQTVNVDYNTLDGSALAGSDYVSTSGSLTFNPGETAKTINVPVIGDIIPEGNETFFAKLTNPTNGVLGRIEAQCVIFDNDGLPTLSIDDVRVTEGNSGTTDAVFRVTLSSPLSQIVAVDFATADGTANAPLDYAERSGRLVFPAGSTTQMIIVPVNGDTTQEPDESFFVNLSNPTNATIARGQGTGTIINDDGGLPSLSINDVRVNEGNSGTTNAVFTVTLSPASNQTVTVNFTTANGTATAPADYTAASGTLSFNPGTTTQAITVQVVGDTIQEPNETFFVNLSNAINASIADSQGVGTILDDDGPSIQFGSTNYSVNENGVANITVTRTGGSLGSVSINFATSNGTAIAGSDYVATSGILTFGPGETSAAFQISILDDSLPENDETLNLTLSNPTGGARIGSPGSAVLTILDNDTSRPGSFQLSSVRQFVRESAGNAVVTVVRDGGSTGPISVGFATSDGTATAGSDYTTASGTLNFASGETSRTFVIPVREDSLAEDTEFFNVILSNPSGGANLGQAIQGQIYILDNERRPPIILGISPICGRTGDFVRISGINFEPGATVLFGNTPGIDVQVVGTTAMTCTVPTGTGTVDLFVTTSQGTARLAAAFTYFPAAKPPGTVLSWFPPGIPEGAGALSLNFLPPPRDLRATRTGGTQTGASAPDSSEAAADRLEAESPLELLSYNIYRSPDPNFSVTDPSTVIIANIPAGVTSFFVPDTVLPGGGRTGSSFYRVTAVYDQGESVATNAASTDVVITGVSLVTRDGRLTLVVQGISFATFRAQIQVNGVTLSQTQYPTGARLGNGASAVIEGIDNFNTLAPVGQTVRVVVVNPGVRSDLSDAQSSAPFSFTRVP